MKTSRRVMVVLMTLGFMAIAAGVVLAAPGGSKQAASGSGQAVPGSSFTTAAVTPTLSLTHPVGLAISKYFSVTYTEVMSLHQSGLGFGEISRLYMIAKYSDGELTPDQILAMRESGQGWGQIMKGAGFKPGGKNLGSIMSGRDRQDKEPPTGRPDKSSPADCPGTSCKAHDKGKSK